MALFGKEDRPVRDTQPVDPAGRRVYRDENGMLREDRVLPADDPAYGDQAAYREQPTYRADDPAYRAARPVYVERRGGGFGRGLLILLLVLGAIVGILFATGFWKADVEGGAMPDVTVTGGTLPQVDVSSKDVVIGSEEKTVEVPTVGIKDDEQQ